MAGSARLIAKLRPEASHLGPRPEHGCDIVRRRQAASLLSPEQRPRALRVLRMLRLQGADRRNIPSTCNPGKVRTRNANARPISLNGGDIQVRRVSQGPRAAPEKNPAPCWRFESPLIADASPLPKQHSLPVPRLRDRMHESRTAAQAQNASRCAFRVQAQQLLCKSRVKAPALSFAAQIRKITGQLITLLLPRTATSGYARDYGSVGHGAGERKQRQLHRRCQLRARACWWMQVSPAASFCGACCCVVKIRMRHRRHPDHARARRPRWRTARAGQAAEGSGLHHRADLSRLSEVRPRQRRQSRQAGAVGACSARAAPSRSATSR